jgi:hypothetical protein
MCVMSHSHVHNASDAHVQAVLEACAGLTLACAYSSSDEYEAEVIQMRRKAGAYGSRHHRQAYVALAMVAAAAVVAVVLAI